MRDQKFYRSPKDFILSYGFYLLFIAVIIIYTCKAPTFLSVENIISILNAATFSLMAAAGTTLVFISGNMDMSIGSIALISAATIAMTTKAGASPLVSVLLAILIGAIIGLVNGILVAYGRMNSMLTTLGLMIAYRGLGLQLTGGRQISLAREFKNFAKIKILGLPIWVALCIITIIVLQIILKKTRFEIGRAHV